ncbi:MAG: TolC family protein [Bacteroidota bacterium]|nr:TolC family protein [Bacteroidota bacterium]
MKRTFFSLVFILFIGQLVIAQESKTTGLSLQQCVQRAVGKNINVKTARIENEKSGYKKEESRSALLPKINLSGSFQDNLALPTTVIPGSFLGQSGNIAVRMGSQYNSAASVSVSQVLYNRTALLAVEITKQSAALSGLSVEKASEEIAAEVAKLYFLTLTTKEQEKLIEDNIARTEKLKNITKITVDNGIGKQVDFDRISVNLENYYTQLSNTQATQEQQLNMMKYMLDIPQEQPIALTGQADTLLVESAPSTMSDFSNHVDIKLLQSQQEINMLNQRSIKSGYLPTVSFSGLFAYQGLQSQFKNYFGNDGKWYPYSYFTINLSVPVFDGFEKRSKSRQAKLEYQKTQEKLESTKESFSMNYKNAMNNYQNNKTNVTRQKQNQKLAEKVYDETALKYREGLATMTNLLQDEISLSNAQAGYLTALYNFKDAEIKIMSLNGDIKNLINK